MDDQRNMDTIRRRLTGLRLRLRLWQGGVGTSRLLAVLAVLVFLSLLVDRTARMDHTQRLLSLLLGSAVLLWGIWRWVVRPLLSRISSEALLLRVEQRQPELESRIIAAWEFAAMTDIPEGASPALVASAIAQGRAAGEKADFHGVIDWPGFRRRARFGGVALVALVALAIAAPPLTESLISTWAFPSIPAKIQLSG